MEKLKRILHVDLDAFFASVEQVENKNIQGKPVIIGGISSRGVVATCSYEAREYGVHSAMPTYKARELCPNGIFLHGRHDLYLDYSKRVFKILNKYSTKIERVSIDEAYLDLMDYPESSIIIAKKIKEEVKNQTGLTISVGISYNKFLAKLGSDWKKPDGLFMITPDMIPRILLDLDILEIHGLGIKTAEKLYGMNIKKIKDLYRLSKDEIIFILGETSGEEIYQRIRGRDQRAVIECHERKSIGVENTLKNNISDRKEIWLYLEKYSIDIFKMMKMKNLVAKTVSIKFKYEDFESYTRSKTVSEYISTEKELLKITSNLFENIKFEKRVRLIGLGVSNLVIEDEKQLCFFEF